MFKILFSLCMLYSLSIAEETILIAEQTTADPSIEKLKADRTHGEHPPCGPSMDEFAKGITPLKVFPTSELPGEPVSSTRKQIIHLLVPHLPTAVTIEVPNNKLITNEEVDINSQLNNTLTTQYPSSMCKHTEISTSSQEDQYLQSYLRASEIFPMPD